MPLIQATDHGLFCDVGGFFIDPWKPVDRALITHAHADHARRGMKHYLCAASGAEILRHRVGRDSDISGLPFGESTSINGVRVSFHPAGHILGSAQIRVEYRGEVWCVSGDFKLAKDPAAEPWEPVRCETFICECTFGLPVYRWPKREDVFADINHWWRHNQSEGRTSVCFAYSLGKAQRVLAGVDRGLGRIGVHGAVEPFLPLYREEGVDLPETIRVLQDTARELKGKGLVVAPGSVQGSPWLRKLAPYSLAFASGWMAVRGARRRNALDRGFILSDHVDWPSLITAVKETGAARVGATHGRSGPFIRYLRDELHLDAFDVPTRFVGEAPDAEESGEA